MPWLADTDVGAAFGCAQGLAAEAPADAALRQHALEALAALVPTDVLTWDRVDATTGTVEHEVIPAEAEPLGAFDSVIERATDHPLLAAHAVHGRPALRLSELVEARRLEHSELYGDLLHTSGVEYEIAIGMRNGPDDAIILGLGRTERQFSERDSDVLNIAGPVIEAALHSIEARRRMVDALTGDPPTGTAVVLLNRDGEIELSSPEADRWLIDHFDAAEHPGWLPAAIADWLALPPRPPLVSERGGRRLTIRLLPGNPHALLLDEQVTSFRTSALYQLSLTPREIEVLRAAVVHDDETEIAWELSLSPYAVRHRLTRLEAKLDVRTPADAVARALRAST